jgi:SAM-dependent methyltransferase
MIGAIRKLLANPQTRGMDLDDPLTTEKRRAVIRGNGFLKKIYDEWYRTLADVVPGGDGAALELGSGAGFMESYIPGLITSEVFFCGGIQLVADARQLPLSSGSLRAILMVDVLHHIPDVRQFLTEAGRCLRSSGVLAMIEPWNTTWSRFIYQHLHHEPFLPDVREWAFPSSGPLSGANGALPWILFSRDRELFEREFPHFHIEQLRPTMPLRYLLSGGVSMRTLTPKMLFSFWKGVESRFHLEQSCGMFASILLRKR